MTVIVGLVEGNTTYMGGDSACSSGDSLSISAKPKVFKKGKFLLGVCGTLRWLDIVHYSFKPPRRPRNIDWDEYMVNYFAKALRLWAQAEDHLLKEDQEVSTVPGLVLVGVEGRLYQIGVDFSVLRVNEAYACTGSGGDYAQAAMWCSRHMDPLERINQAMTCAEFFCTSVRNPFTIVTHRHTTKTVDSK